ncbi:MAG: hypothetical protein V4463_07195 [Pseudomonadota bacterium]
MSTATSLGTIVLQGTTVPVIDLSIRHNPALPVYEQFSVVFTVLRPDGSTCGIDADTLAGKIVYDA